MTADPSGPVAGIDVGGTWTVAVVVDAAGAELGRARLPTSADGAAGFLGGVADALDRALGGVAPGALSAIGIGIPGQVDPGTGTVRLAMNLRIDVEGVPVARLLERRLGVPVVITSVRGMLAGSVKG